MKHPSFGLKNKKHAKAIRNTYKDEFLRENFDDLNTAFGCNSIESLMEENCVQTLEQLLNEKYNVEVEAKKRWKETMQGCTNLQWYFTSK